MAAIIKEQYSWDLTVFEGGAAESGVRIYIWDFTFPTPVNVVDQDTIGDGTIPQQTLSRAEYSITGTTTVATEDKTPHRIHAGKYGLTRFGVDKSFVEASKDSYFLNQNTNITEANKSTVELYTGISFTPNLAIASHAFTNNTALLNIGAGVTNQGIGQSMAGTDNVPNKFTVELKKVGSPTGNAVAKIYAESGNIPTGSALATSDPVDVEKLTTGTEEEVTFFFSTAVKLASGSNWFLTVEYSGGDVSNYIQVAYQSVGSYVGGNKATLATATWTAQTGEDVAFAITGGRIQITSNHTMAEIYDYGQSWLEDNPQYEYLEILETADGTSFSCVWDFEASNAAVTGPAGLSLVMPNNDFRLVSGGTFGGVVTDIDGTATFIQFTNLITDSEVRIYRQSDDAELAGTESSGTSFTYNFTHTADVPITVVIFHLNYRDIRIVTLSLTAASQSIPIQQQFDRSYSNPA